MHQDRAVMSRRLIWILMLCGFVAFSIQRQAFTQPDSTASEQAIFSCLWGVECVHKGDFPIDEKSVFPNPHTFNFSIVELARVSSCGGDVVTRGQIVNGYIIRRGWNFREFPEGKFKKPRRYPLAQPISRSLAEIFNFDPYLERTIKINHMSGFDINVSPQLVSSGVFGDFDRRISGSCRTAGSKSCPGSEKNGDGKKSGFGDRYDVLVISEANKLFSTVGHALLRREVFPGIILLVAFSITLNIGWGTFLFHRNRGWRWCGLILTILSGLGMFGAFGLVGGIF